MSIVRVELNISIQNEEEEKIYWLTMNVILNGLGASSCDQEYSYLEEAKLWAKSPDYFPNLTWEEFLEIACKYDFWNLFEKIWK